MTTVKCDFCAADIKGEHKDRLVLSLERCRTDGVPTYHTYPQQSNLLKAFDLCAACMEEFWRQRELVLVNIAPPVKST